MGLRNCSSLNQGSISSAHLPVLGPKATGDAKYVGKELAGWLVCEIRSESDAGWCFWAFCFLLFRLVPFDACYMDCDCR